MAAIIREDAPPLDANTPTPLRWIIERCLSKDPADRYDSTRDLYRELLQTKDRLSDIAASGAPVAWLSDIMRRQRALFGDVGDVGRCLYANHPTVMKQLCKQSLRESAVAFSALIFSEADTYVEST